MESIFLADCIVVGLPLLFFIAMIVSTKTLSTESVSSIILYLQRGH
jgi:hypothetical protein